MTPKAYALCQLPLSLCADVPPPSEKKLNFFSGGGRGGRRLYTGYSLLTNQLSIGWTLFKLATWRCLPKVSISKTVEIYHIKFLMCFTQGWEFLSFDVTAAVQQRENSTTTPVPIVFYLQFKMASLVG